AVREGSPDLKAAASGEVRVTLGPSVGAVTDTTAFIGWSTSVSTKSFLRYGLAPEGLDRVTQSPSGGTTHSVQLRNLSPDTTYFYRVVTSAPQATEPMSRPARFRTKPKDPRSGRIRG